MPESKQERTEQPTQRRKERARRKGQVVKSAELKSALMVLTGVAALKFAGPWMKGQMVERFIESFARVADTSVTVESTPTILGSWASWSAGVLAPVFGVLVLVGIGAGWLIQGGVLFTTQSITFNLARLNPVTGAAQLFSGQLFFKLFRDGVKVLLIGYVCYRVVKEAIALTLDKADVGLWHTLSNVSDLVFSLCLKGGLVLLFLGFIDYTYMRREYFKDLRMTKRELKEEHKMSEGDPLIRSRIRAAQRELARRRMMQAVPTADVVLTNPTEIAVALKYDPETMNAPRVVAKGQRLIAEKIKALAKEFGVPIVEDKPLARSLFHMAAIGAEIPVELYRAVAEVLSYVYRLKGRLSPAHGRA